MKKILTLFLFCASVAFGQNISMGRVTADTIWSRAYGNLPTDTLPSFLVVNGDTSDYLPFPSTHHLYTNTSEEVMQLLNFKFRVTGDSLSPLSATEAPRHRIEILMADSTVRQIYSGTFTFGAQAGGYPIDAVVYHNSRNGYNGSGFDPLSATKLAYYTGIVFEPYFVLLPGESLRITLVNANVGNCDDKYKWREIIMTFIIGGAI